MELSKDIQTSIRRLACKFHTTLRYWYDIDDLINIAYIRILQSIHKYDSTRGYSLKSYVLLLAKSAILDEARRSVRQHKVALSSTLEDVNDDNDDIDDFDQAEEYEILLSYVDNEDHRKVVRRWTCSETLEQIGKSYSRSKGGMLNIRNKAFEQIRSKIA